MSVSKEDVKHIAKLSKLNLTQEELEKYTNELSSIVDFANELSNINVEGIKPTAHILDIKNVFRKDEVKEFKDIDGLMQNAPDKERGMFKIPKVIN